MLLYTMGDKNTCHRTKKIMLLFPPDWFPSEPYLSLPSLTSVLRSAGHLVVQKDVNLEMYDWFFSSNGLQIIFEKAPKQLERLKNKSALLGLDDNDRSLKQALTGCTKARINELSQHAEEAKKIVTSPDFFDVKKLEWAINIFHEVTSVISLVYAPAIIRLPPMETTLPYNTFISTELLKAIKDAQVNVYRDVYRQILHPSINAENPDIIGISIVLKQQLISSLTFCSLIKEDFPHIHITIGGNTVTRLRDILPEKPDLFAVFDSAIVFEGETALLKLVETLGTTRNLATVPNVIFRDASGIHTSPLIMAEDVTKLPVPDFDGLPLEKYFVPELILPYVATRGCYWGRCKFCDHGEGYTAGYRAKKISQIIDDIHYLQNKYHTHNFHFPDESYPPALFKKLSYALIKNNMNIAWMTHLRFENSLTNEEIWETAANAGCKYLHLGFESGSERILKRMDKSTTTNIMSKMLKISSNAGIWNHVMGFFGFPGESYEDAQQTIQFLEKNKEFVHSIGFGTFDLCKYAPVTKENDTFGITYYKNPEWDLALNYYYTVDEGLGIEESEKLLEAFEKNHYEGWDLRIFIREYVFLYVAHYGTNRLYSLLCHSQNRSVPDFL
ncbi:MAG: B12-binding domain-containing radical SAM protein [Candidatus Kuenenia sp.]|nr:B12-binding domain-containing radical SAM protein [Candidatus Kuenenia sp.]